MIENLNYPLKIWMTSVLVGPLLLFSPSYVQSSATSDNLLILSTDFLAIYFISIFAGAAISSPCFLILWICYWLVVKWGWTTIQIRIGLLVISLLCCIGIFLLSAFVDSTFIWTTGNIRLIAAYALPLAFGVTVYRLNKLRISTTTLDQESKDGIQ